MTKSWENTNQL